jgi:hypothetical protein
MDQLVKGLQDPNLIAALANPQLKDALRAIFGSPFDVSTFLGIIATAIITAISASIIVLQLRLDHERSRRETAVNLVREWTLNLRIETYSIVNLVKQFSDVQCRALEENKDIHISDNSITTEEVLNCLWHTFPELKEADIIINNRIIIKTKHSSYIRFTTVRYLNLLESVLSAWNTGIARRDIIEEQFGFLKTGGLDLAKFRAVIYAKRGLRDGYPSITNFLTATGDRIGKPLGLLGRIKLTT